MLKKLTQMKSNDHLVDLEVTQNGLVVSVAGGPFKYAGEEYTLVQTDWTAEEWDHDVSVHGWLVKDEAGDASLAVDEAHGDGPYEWAGSPYTKLDLLFHLFVPANTTTLDDVEITVRHILAPPPPPAKPPKPTPEEVAAAKAEGVERRAAKAEARKQVPAELAERRSQQAAADRAAREAREAAATPPEAPPARPSVSEIHQAWQQAKARGEV